MPETIPQTYFSRRPVDYHAFAKVLHRCWVEGEWRPLAPTPEEERPIFIPWSTFETARYILELADGRVSST